ncbi:MAG: DUF429 domain-containing protein [Chloroflexota bacterium]
MLFTRATFIGVDISPRSKSLSYAAIDGNLKIIAMGEGDNNEILAFLGGQQEAVVAMNAPAQPNQGFMAQEDYREKLIPQPKSGKWTDLRVCEYILIQQDILVYHTISNPKKAKRWMREGFQIYKRLQTLGYQITPGESDLLLIEAIPEVSYATWLGKLLLPYNNLEGRLQRQLILYELGLGVPEPMGFFEEITRFRLLQGELPKEVLYSAGELQALANAYLAWAYSNRNNSIAFIGEEKEGGIFLPSATI